MFTQNPPFRDELAAQQRAFLDEVADALAARHLPLLDESRIRVARTAGGVLEIDLPHKRDPDTTIHLRVEDGEAIIGVLGYHTHFDDLLCQGEDGTWMGGAVAFVVELLEGKLGVEATSRGGRIVQATLWHQTNGNDWHPGDTVTGCSLAFLNPFAKSTRRRKRISFVGPNREAPCSSAHKSASSPDDGGPAK